MNKYSGMGFSEVLVSLFIASMIFITLTHLYVNAKRHYVRSQQLLENEFEIQWVSDLLRDSIWRAGFTPCLGVERLQTQDARHSGQKLLALSDSDKVLQINRMNEFFTEKISILNSRELNIAANLEIHAHQSVIISDCHHAEVHRVSTVEALGNRQHLVLSEPLIYLYHKPFYLGSWLEERWMIKTNVQGHPSLHYQLNHTEELSSLIHSLAVNFQKIHNQQVIQIRWTTYDDQQQELVAAVRGL